MRNDYWVVFLLWFISLQGILINLRIAQIDRDIVKQTQILTTPQQVITVPPDVQPSPSDGA